MDRAAAAAAVVGRGAKRQVHEVKLFGALHVAVRVFAFTLRLFGLFGLCRGPTPL